MAVKILLSGGDPSAGGKSVPLISWVAAALWDMVGHGAGGVDTTHPRARVTAVLIHTSLVPWALRVDNALRLTFNVGVANVIPDAATRGSASSFTAFGISSTRGRIAGLNDLNWSRCC